MPAARQTVSSACRGLGGELPLPRTPELRHVSAFPWAAGFQGGNGPRAFATRILGCTPAD